MENEYNVDGIDMKSGFLNNGIKTMTLNNDKPSYDIKTSDQLKMDTYAQKGTFITEIERIKDNC